MVFQLPKADHKAIFEKHRRDRAIRRKVSDEGVTADDAAATTTEAQGVARDKTPITEAPAKTAHEVVETPSDIGAVEADAHLAAKDIKPTSAAKSVSVKSSTKSINSKQSRETQKASPPNTNTEATVSLKIRIALPHEGQSVTYDRLALQIGPQQAVRMLLKRAFDDLRETLRNENKLPSAPAYLATKDRFVTNKLIATGELAAAKSSLDPSSIMNPMMFNRTLAERALALFFQKENQGA